MTGRPGAPAPCCWPRCCSCHSGRNCSLQPGSGPPGSRGSPGGGPAPAASLGRGQGAWVSRTVCHACVRACLLVARGDLPHGFPPPSSSARPVLSSPAPRPSARQAHEAEAEAAISPAGVSWCRGWSKGHCPLSPQLALTPDHCPRAGWVRPLPLPCPLIFELASSLPTTPHSTQLHTRSQAQRHGYAHNHHRGYPRAPSQGGKGTHM